MIARALSALGLMKRSEHERIVAENDDRAYDSWIKMINERDFYVDEYKVLEAKFKLAATDLAKQADELNDAKLHIDHLGITFLQSLADAVQDYQADALKWRNSLKRSRDRKAAKQGTA